MGCVQTITYDRFPKQKGRDYKYPQFAVGSRVSVCYYYNTSKTHLGTIQVAAMAQKFIDSQEEREKSEGN